MKVEMGHQLLGYDGIANLRMLKPPLFCISEGACNSKKNCSGA
jgi:hypothetical protein